MSVGNCYTKIGGLCFDSDGHLVKDAGGENVGQSNVVDSQSLKNIAVIGVALFGKLQ